MRLRFICELVGKNEPKVVHVASEWQHGDILTKALHVTLFKRHRKALLNLPAEEYAFMYERRVDVFVWSLDV